MSRIERLRERLVYENAYYRVFDDSVRFPGGREGSYFRVQNADNPVAAVIVPRFPNGDFLMQRNFRYAADRVMLEFPRGLGETGEDAEGVARRELAEETGLRPERFQFLGELHPNGAVLEERVAAFLVELPADRTCERDGDEATLRHERVPESKLRTLVRAGEVTDGFTLAALCLLDAATE